MCVRAVLPPDVSGLLLGGKTLIFSELLKKKNYLPWMFFKYTDLQLLMVACTTATQVFWNRTIL